MNAENFLNDIPYNLAVSAFNGTSFTPEKRAESYRNDYASTLATDLETLRGHAANGGTIDQVDAEFAQYRAGYAKRYRAWLSAHSRCLSSMIAGPSNFPVRRAERANAVERGRLEDCIGYRERALKAAIRNLRPDLRPIMAGDADAVDRLTAEIVKAEAIQASMKSANAAIRKHAKAGPDAQVAALVALGFNEARTHDLLKPDFCGRIGFANFELTNNNANIRRMKERLATISKSKTTESMEIEGDGVRFEDCPADNRVRLFFDGKPSDEVRAKLKKNGFRWSPSIGAWQAYRNNWSMELAKSFVSA